ncbi:hypothetical protein HW555_002727, partial [Spodoptera exigua]
MESNNNLKQRLRSSIGTIKSLRRWWKRGKRRRMAPKIKTILRPGCVICRHGSCVDERKHDRVTRSLTKEINSMEFILIETYRCMPLLGNEEYTVPDWNIHIEWNIGDLHKEMGGNGAYYQTILPMLAIFFF